jgi:hypothetical protein
MVYPHPQKFSTQVQACAQQWFPTGERHTSKAGFARNPSQPTPNAQPNSSRESGVAHAGNRMHATGAPPFFL